MNGVVAPKYRLSGFHFDALDPIWRRRHPFKRLEPLGHEAPFGQSVQPTDKFFSNPIFGGARAVNLGRAGR